MKVAMLGLGAVGGHVASRLARGGWTPSLVARGATAAALARDGLSLQVGEDTLHARLPVFEDPARLGPQDLVICAVKATDPEGLASTLGPLVGTDTAVVFAQNGIPWWYPHGLGDQRRPAPDLGVLDPRGALSAVVSPGQAIGAVINSSNEVVSPGVVRNNSPAVNMLQIGEVDDRDSERVADLRGVLEAGGMASPPVPDIRQAIWSKLLINMSASLLCLITGRRANGVAADPGLARIFLAVAAEGIQVATAHGIDLSAVNPQAWVAKAPDHLPSVRQDYEQGRALELAALALAPQAFARAAGIATPHLDTIVALAVHQGVERGVFTAP